VCDAGREGVKLEGLENEFRKKLAGHGFGGKNGFSAK